MYIIYIFYICMYVCVAINQSICRGICMLRKNLNSPSDLSKMPSLLGRIFRIAMYGRDDFDYAALASGRLTCLVCVLCVYVCMYVCMYVVVSLSI